MTTLPTTIAPPPAPPADHWISKLTCSFQDAILLNEVRDLKHINTFYDHCMVSEPDILKFDRSQLLTTLNLTQKIINASIPPILTQTPLSYYPLPSSRFKSPRMEIPGWVAKITNSTPGYLPVPEALKPPNALEQSEHK